MSNKEILLDFFRTAKVDEAKMISYVAENAVYIAIREEPNDKCPLYGTYVGHDGYKKLFANLKAEFDTKKFEIHGATDDENSATAYGYFEHIVKSTGKLFCSHWSIVVRFENKKIIHSRFFEDTAALEEAFAS